MNKNTISISEINSELKTQYIGRDLYFFETTTSTFDESDKLVPKNGMVVCAKNQTNGRGRLGRQWESNIGGIYFSVILNSDFVRNNINIITPLCAVAIKRAISKHTPCKIKWPNDIVSDCGKKLCGILTKVQSNAYGNLFVNVGIGINANTQNFDSELCWASSVKIVSGKEVNENKLFCDCLFEIENCLENEPANSVMSEFKSECLTLGKSVRLVSHRGIDDQIGVCTDIGDDGTLIVQKDNGDIIKVNSGEVSVRGIYGENYV